MKSAQYSEKHKTGNQKRRNDNEFSRPDRNTKKHT